MDKTIQKRRSQSEIMLDILRIASSPIRPTRILALSNCCYSAFQTYSSKLISMGFLEELEVKPNGRKLIATTQKGLEFTRRCEEIFKYLEP